MRLRSVGKRLDQILTPAIFIVGNGYQRGAKRVADLLRQHGSHGISYDHISFMALVSYLTSDFECSPSYNTNTKEHHDRRQIHALFLVRRLQSCISLLLGTPLE